MSIGEAWDEIQNWINLYAGKNPLIIVLSLGAMIYLLLSNKSIRNSMIIPIIMIIPVVINPILYKYVYKDLRYWRFFWMLPEVVLIGIAFADISKRMEKQWIKCLSLLVVAGTLMIVGKYAFSSETRIPKSLQPAENLYKVSQYVKENCDIILADNPSPKCIFQDGACETRQYSGNIMQMYGRDVDGYIIGPSQNGKLVANSWNGEEQDQENIFKIAAENGYTHICCRTTEKFDDFAENYGYSILSKTEEWTIYHRL